MGYWAIKGWWGSAEINQDSDIEVVAKAMAKIRIDDANAKHQ
jgi:hypothetical protein